MNQFPFYRELGQKRKLVCGLARSVISCFLGSGVFDLPTPIVPLSVAVIFNAELISRILEQNH